MPFNVGPFEVIFVVVLICAISALVLQAKIKGPPPPVYPTRTDEAPEPESLDTLIAHGWRIESESSDYVFLIKGQRVNHLLHFLVGLLTLGVWWIVWLILAAKGGEERQTIRK